MNPTIVVSLLWAGAITALFGLGLLRRWRRHTLPLVGTALFVTALFTTCAIAAVALQAGDPALRRTLSFAAWGAFTAAAVFYATVLSDP